MPRVPKRLVEELDSLQLSPSDKHLLSLVDGSLSAQELAFSTGKSLEQITEELERLAMLGMVDFVGRRADDGAGGGAAAAAAAAAGGDEPGPGASAVAGVELDAEEIAAIDALLARLNRSNYYELLGVPTDASKKEIRKAYNQLARRFHPDRHFRKQLGPYKQKIEKVFAELTRAHDTLRSKQGRREYDESEGIEHRVREDAPKKADSSAATPVAVGPRSVPPGSRAEPAAPGEQPELVVRPPSVPPPQSPAVRPAAPGAAADSARPPAGATVSTPPGAPVTPAAQTEAQPARSRRPAARAKPRAVDAAAPGAASRPAPPVQRSPARAGRAGPAARTTTPGLGGADADKARRIRAEALKRKMASARRFSVPPPGGLRAARTTNPRMPPPAPASAEPQTTPDSYEPVKDVGKSAAEVYRERFDRIGRVARQRRCERFVAQAKAAFSRGDYRLAAEAFQMAAELSGDDPQLRALAEQAAELAAGGK